MRRLLQYLHTGGGQPPGWYINLVLAEQWHCKPWEVEGVPMKWVYRQFEANIIRAEVIRLRPK